MEFGLGSSRVIFTLVCLIVRCVPGLPVVLFRRDLSKDAELLFCATRTRCSLATATGCGMSPLTGRLARCAGMAHTASALE